MHSQPTSREKSLLRPVSIVGIRQPTGTVSTSLYAATSYDPDGSMPPRTRDPPDPPQGDEHIMSIPLLTFFTLSAPTWVFPTFPHAASVSLRCVAAVPSPFFLGSSPHVSHSSVWRVDAVIRAVHAQRRMTAIQATTVARGRARASRVMSPRAGQTLRLGAYSRLRNTTLLARKAGRWLSTTTSEALPTGSSSITAKALRHFTTRASLLGRAIFPLARTPDKRSFGFCRRGNTPPLAGATRSCASMTTQRHPPVTPLHDYRQAISVFGASV